MKVCDIVQFYSPLGGGVRRYIEDKIRIYAGNPEIDHSIIVPSDRNDRQIFHSTKVFHVKSMPLVGSNSYRVLRSRRYILSLLASIEPHIIEVDNPYFSAWTAIAARERFDIPVVAFYHSDFPRALGRTVQRFTNTSIENLISAPFKRYIVSLYNRMDATIVASRRIEALLQDCGINNLVRIPLGTDVERFYPHPDPQSLRDELGLNPGDVLLVFVGRLAREKHIHSLIEMTNLLAKRFDSQKTVHLLLVGDGELRRYVQSQVISTPYITWKKYCTSSEELRRCYTAADLFIHAGDYETFGITSLEAQACGSRVIAIDGGGMEDTLEGEEPKILAQSSAPQDLAEAVQKAVSVDDGQTPEERRQRIIENFSLDRTVARIIGLYQHILAGLPIEAYTVASPEEQDHEHSDKAIYTE